MFRMFICYNITNDSNKNFDHYLLSLAIKLHLAVTFVQLRVLTQGLII